MAQETEAALRANLSALSLSGVLAFDPSDKHVADMMINISQSGTLLGNLAFSTSSSRTDIRITSVLDKTDVVFSLTGDEKRSDMKITVSQNSTELGQLTGYITREGKSLREISLEATVQ